MCRSRADSTPSCGCGADSLQPRPARSYTQTRVVGAMSGATQLAIIVDGSPRPPSRTTTGLPAPVQLRWSLWLPTATSRPGISDDDGSLVSRYVSYAPPTALAASAANTG